MRPSRSARAGLGPAAPWEARLRSERPYLPAQELEAWGGEGGHNNNRLLLCYKLQLSVRERVAQPLQRETNRSGC